MRIFSSVLMVCGLHFLDRRRRCIRRPRSPAGAPPCRAAGPAASRSRARGSNSTMIDCSWIRAARFSAPSEANGSSWPSTLAERSSRSRRTVAARLRHQDQHADDRLLEAAAIDRQQDRLHLRQEAQQLRILARALEGERLAEAQHRGRAVDPEEGHFVGGVAQVAHEVERVDDARRPRASRGTGTDCSGRPAARSASAFAACSRRPSSADLRRRTCARDTRAGCVLRRSSATCGVTARLDERPQPRCRRVRAPSSERRCDRRRNRARPSGRCRRWRECRSSCVRGS